MTKRKFLRILKCHLVKSHRFKPTRFKRNKDDITVRLEYLGSYIQEYYFSYEDSKMLIRLHKEDYVCNGANGELVFHIDGCINCVFM